MNLDQTLIIAEAGVNHNGDFDVARKLVDAAAVAGADLVKFQTFSADRLVTPDAGRAGYQNRNTDDNDTQHAMLKKLELSRSQHEDLIEYCGTRGIGFFSTGFDVESLDMLVELGIDRIKVPSGEITNLPYLRHVAGLKLPVIISTGMSEMAEIEAAFDVMLRSGVPIADITILHCNTEYPTPMQDVNLRAMLSIKERFGAKIGYSDHTTGIEVATAAVAMGASVIEKHFTLDRTMSGPDHAASLEPDELTAMVQAIRNIEQALGDGVKKPSASELGNIPIARKSLVAARSIGAGEVFTPDNVAAKRPGTGISPMRWDEVIGQTAMRDFAADELIEI